MQLSEYLNLALRTESKIDSISLNKKEFVTLLEMYSALGEMLDAYKKKIFYKKDKKYNDIFFNKLDEIHNLIYTLRSSRNDEQQLILENEQHTRGFHGMLGILTEAAEMSEILHKLVEDGEVDIVNLSEEMADGAGGTNSWYAAILCDAYGIDPEVPMVNNIEKLRVRYPDKFTEQNACERDLAAERKKLEENV